jgi:hypothetical protein
MYNPLPSHYQGATACCPVSRVYFFRFLSLRLPHKLPFRAFLLSLYSLSSSMYSIFISLCNLYSSLYSLPARSTTSTLCYPTILAYLLSCLPSTLPCSLNSLIFSLYAAVKFAKQSHLLAVEYTCSLFSLSNSLCILSCSHSNTSCLINSICCLLSCLTYCIDILQRLPASLFCFFTASRIL